MFPSTSKGSQSALRFKNPKKLTSTAAPEKSRRITDDFSYRPDDTRHPFPAVFTSAPARLPGDTGSVIEGQKDEAGCLRRVRLESGRESCRFLFRVCINDAARGRGAVSRTPPRSRSRLSVCLSVRASLPAPPRLICVLAVSCAPLLSSLADKRTGDGEAPLTSVQTGALRFLAGFPEPLRTVFANYGVKGAPGPHRLLGAAFVSRPCAGLSSGCRSLQVLVTLWPAELPRHRAAASLRTVALVPTPAAASQTLP